jgi:coatomer subunit beta'
VALWKQDLSSISESAANALACPKNNPDRFPDIDIASGSRKDVSSTTRCHQVDSSSFEDYLTAKDDMDLNLINLIKEKRGLPVVSEAEIAAEAARIAAEEAARKQAEEEAAFLAAQEAAALRAAEEAAAAEAAAAVAAAEAAVADPMDESNDFADDWERTQVQYSSNTTENHE